MLNPSSYMFCTILSNAPLKDFWEKSRQFNKSDSIWLERKEFQDKLLADKKFIELAGERTFLQHIVKAESDRRSSKIDSDTFDLLKIKKESGRYITIWNFIGQILANSISIIKDTRPTTEFLADSIHKWRDQHEVEYQNLKDDFTSVFPNTTFHLQKNPKNNHTTILISEKERSFPLENSASGYFAGLYLLFTIYGEKENTLFFDEPETHFHPTKLEVISNKLSELATSGSNQMTIITHSPSLLDFSVLQNDLFNVVYMKRDSNFSSVHQPKQGFVPKIKPYHFEPSVFFERGVIVVEGPSDEYTIKAISDSYSQLLKKSSIGIVNAGGKGQVEPYVSLLKQYGVPHVAMVDSDYSDKSDGIIKLEQDLEHELEKLGWNRKTHENGGKEKIHAENAYNFIIQLLKDDSKKIEFEKSPLWQVIQTILKVSL